MKKILITYNDKLCEALIVRDFKVAICPEDETDPNGVRMFVADKEKSVFCIELDQCRDCGTWCSEDDEFYGDGYCTKCCDMCSECQQYKSNKGMTIINGERVCKDCIDAYKNTCPNSYKYHKAIDECPYGEAIDGDLKVQFEYIGEGSSGDYTGEEDDIPYMRFYTYKKEYVEDGQGIDHPDWNWVEMEDGSFCTYVDVLTPNETLNKLAKAVLDKIKEVVECDDDGGIPEYNIRKVAGESSWVDETWIKE
jgi:hypothetical protein